MGRPYHISALYVVDLKAFRRMAVGDTVSWVDEDEGGARVVVAFWLHFRLRSSKVWGM